MKVAIVGSRDYPDLDAVRAYVRALPLGTVVVSGGADGVDKEAVSEARSRFGMGWQEFLPNWAKYGARAGAVRNAEIVAFADRVVAFWNGTSKGTKITIDMARRAGKPCEVVTPPSSTKETT